MGIPHSGHCRNSVSVLYREPMWLKYRDTELVVRDLYVSVLYREPMWLKYGGVADAHTGRTRFSALP